jgi:cytochrome c peroxidase
MSPPAPAARALLCKSSEGNVMSPRWKTALALLPPTAVLAGLASVMAAQAPGQSIVPNLAAMKADYRRPSTRSVDNLALADLGRLLFWDPRVSASGNTACASCHVPYLGWAATEARSRNDSGKLTARKSQPLIGIGYAKAPYGWAGSNATLEAQVKSSISTGAMSMRETDSPVKPEMIEQRIRAVPEYVEKFAAALPGAAITMDTIARAVVVYERTFEPGIAPFDRWVAGDEAAISESAKQGFALFNGKANCFACHSGWRFTDDLFHDIGTTTTDLGRGRELKTEELMQYAFKTPTLRSVALRPPYMHGGSSTALHDVVRHYEKGGIDRPSRSPLLLPLDLSEREQLDLVAFMQTLTGAPEGDTAPRLPGLHKYSEGSPR